MEVKSKTTRSTKSKTTRSTKPKTTRSTKPKTTRSTKPKAKKYSTKKKIGSGVVYSTLNPDFVRKLYQQWSYNDKIAFYVNHISFLKYVRLSKNLRHYRNKKKDSTGKVYPWVDKQYSQDKINMMLKHFEPLAMSVNRNISMDKRNPEI